VDSISTFHCIIRLTLALVVSCPLANAFAAPSKEWITMENCRLVPNPANDGDSFHIQSNGKEYLARLYFVDAPETQGGIAAGRLIEQAAYFGISVPQVVEVGNNAKLFVEAKLSEPFTFLTREASGLGRSTIERFYGFVQTKEGDLGELLVANGLARVHGTKVVRPGASSGAEEVQKLQQLEEKAKQAKLGGWGINSASSAAPQPTRTVSLPSVAPVQALAPPPAQSIRSPAATASSSSSIAGDKLDINTASKEELRKIPGIGDALADRIIAERPFSSADDLKKVKGVGEGKRYEQLRPYFR